MKSIRLVKLFIIGFCLLLPVSVSIADEPSPVLIEADRMISREQDNSVVFIGGVEARQGNIIIRSQEMTVYYSQEDNSKGMASEMEKLICRDNVEISRDDWLGTGDHMVYYAKKRKVVLSGNAKAWHGRNMVSGEKIIHYLDEERTIVEQGENAGGRVKAIIHPESDKK